METPILQRALLIWLGLFAIGFANGTLRELLIKKFIQEPWAHHLSALTAALFFAAYIWGIWQKTMIVNATQAATIGALWFVLTILTETFVLNRWISGLSWNQILQTYNVASGELWPLVLIWIGVLPVIVFYLRSPS